MKVRHFSVVGLPIMKVPAGMRTMSERVPSMYQAQALSGVGVQTLRAAGSAGQTPVPGSGPTGRTLEVLLTSPSEQDLEAHWLSAVQTSPSSLPMLMTRL